MLSNWIYNIMCIMYMYIRTYMHCILKQELVNLLLCGVAVSNVFDGSMELASGGSTNVSNTSPLPLCMHVAMYIRTYNHVCVCIHVSAAFTKRNSYTK